MDQEQRNLLSLRHLPACLSQQESAWYLGYKTHDIRILVAAGLLRPLGHPNQSSIKYFAAVELERCRQDIKWLGRATDAIYKAWRLKNGTETISRNKSEPTSTNAPVTGLQNN